MRWWCEKMVKVGRVLVEGLGEKMLKKVDHRKKKKGWMIKKILIKF